MDFFKYFKVFFEEGIKSIPIIIKFIILLINFFETLLKSDSINKYFAPTFFII